MSATKTKNQKATYWEYTGNHIDGSDCSRQNPYGYPMALVSYVANQFTEAKVKVINIDSSGRTVEVSATKEIWDKAWVELAYELGSQTDFDLVREDEFGNIWGCILDYDEVIYQNELFYISDDEPLLDQIKGGYAIISINGQSYLVSSKQMTY